MAEPRRQVLKLFPEEKHDPSSFPNLPVGRTRPGCFVKLLGGLAFSALFAAGDVGWGERWATFFIILFVAVLIGSLQRQSSQNTKDTIAAKVLGDLKKGIQYPFSLYLRPFLVTNRIRIRNPEYARMSVSNPDKLTDQATIDLETLLAERVWRGHPFVALGRPGEGFGVGRVQTHEKDWKTDIELLINSATLIYVIPAAREGIEWELKYIRDNALLRKCIFIMPPEPQRKIRIEFTKEMWKAAEPELQKIGLSLPHYRDSGLLFTLDCDGQIKKTAELIISGFGELELPELSEPN